MSDLADRLLQALPVKDEGRIHLRVPKTTLVESGRFTAVQRRRLTAAIEELWWELVLKPETTGLLANDPVNATGVPAVQELQVLRLVPKGPLSAVLPLVSALHRAIDHPVLLILDHRDGVWLSLAHKRPAAGTAVGMVIEGTVVTQPVSATAPWLGTFLAALGSPLATDLRGVYAHWHRCLTAIARATASGHFAVPADDAAAMSIAADLDACVALQREQTSQTKALQRERQMARRVSLNLRLQSIATELQACRLRLSQTDAVSPERDRP